MREFKIHLVETMSEVSQKSNVKLVTKVKRKTGSKGKSEFKTLNRTSLDVQFKEFSLT